jgi:hypothetical protein
MIGKTAGNRGSGETQLVRDGLLVDFRHGMVLLNECTKLQNGGQGKHKECV